MIRNSLFVLAFVEYMRDKPNGVDLRLYAGLFCLTRGAAKAEPASQPRVHLTIFVSQIFLSDL